MNLNRKIIISILFALVAVGIPMVYAIDYAGTSIGTNLSTGSGMKSSFSTPYIEGLRMAIYRKNGDMVEGTLKYFITGSKENKETLNSLLDIYYDERSSTYKESAQNMANLICSRNIKYKNGSLNCTRNSNGNYSYNKLTCVIGSGDCGYGYNNLKKRLMGLRIDYNNYFDYEILYPITYGTPSLTLSLEYLKNNVYKDTKFFSKSMLANVQNQAQNQWEAENVGKFLNFQSWMTDIRFDYSSALPCLLGSCTVYPTIVKDKLVNLGIEGIEDMFSSRDSDLRKHIEDLIKIKKGQEPSSSYEQYKYFIVVEPFVNITFYDTHDSVSKYRVFMGTTYEFALYFKNYFNLYNNGTVPRSANNPGSDDPWDYGWIRNFIQRDLPNSLYIKENSPGLNVSEFRTFVEKYAMGKNGANVKRKYVETVKDSGSYTFDEMITSLYGIGIYSLSDFGEKSCTYKGTTYKLSDYPQYSSFAAMKKEKCPTVCPANTAKSGDKCTDNDDNGVCDNIDADCNIPKCDFNEVDHFNGKTETDKDCCILNNITYNRPASQNDIYDAYPRCYDGSVTTSSNGATCDIDRTAGVSTSTSNWRAIVSIGRTASKDSSKYTVHKITNSTLNPETNCYLYCVETVNIDFPASPSVKLLKGGTFTWPDKDDLNRQLKANSTLTCRAHVQDVPNKQQQQACKNTINGINLSGIGKKSKVNIKLVAEGNLSLGTSSIDLKETTVSSNRDVTGVGASNAQIVFKNNYSYTMPNSTSKINIGTGNLVSNPVSGTVASIKEGKIKIESIAYNQSTKSVGGKVRLNYNITGGVTTLSPYEPYSCPLKEDKSNKPGGDQYFCYGPLENGSRKEVDITACVIGKNKDLKDALVECRNEEKDCLNVCTPESCPITYCPPKSDYPNKICTDNNPKDGTCDNEATECYCTGNDCKPTCNDGKEIVLCDDNDDGVCDEAEKEKHCGGDNLVVYRTIELSNPFPGLTSNKGRPSGLNWIQDSVKKYITNNRGVEADAVFNQTPMYSIKLTPAKIKAIRNYNKTQSDGFNDFKMTCKNGNCTSEFMKDDTNWKFKTKCKYNDGLTWASCQKDGGR